MPNTLPGSRFWRLSHHQVSLSCTNESPEKTRSTTAVCTCSRPLDWRSCTRPTQSACDWHAPAQPGPASRPSVSPKGRYLTRLGVQEGRATDRTRVTVCPQIDLRHDSV